MTNKDYGGIRAMYVNNLISLQENSSTYGIDNSKVTGHVTLSSPGMIKCYVQNLKPASSNKGYMFCIFSKHHNKGIKVGKLGTEKESKWLVDEKNIKGSGIKLEDIDAVAIVAERDMQGVDVIVVGFSKDKYLLLSIIDQLFPRNEQKTTTQIAPKAIPSHEKPVVEKEKVPVEKSKAEEKEKMQVEKPKVEEKEKLPVEKPNVEEKEKMPVEKPKVEEKEKMQMEKPKVEEKEKVQMEKPEVIEQGPGPVILPSPTPSSKEKTCGCNDFILPQGAVQGEMVKEMDEKPINEELKRIIDSISKDKRVEEKAKELEKLIRQMNELCEEPKVMEKPSVEKILEQRYMSQKINFDELLEEEAEEDFDTNPKKALECINQMNKEENYLDEEVVEEQDYLKEIENRLKEIKARMNEAAEKQRVD